MPALPRPLTARAAFRLLSENRNKLLEVEAELSVLRRDIKLTSAPKKQAMELMRRKIEARRAAAAGPLGVH